MVIPRRILDGDFAGWLRDAMAARNMSQRMLAHRAGISHSTVYRLAMGEAVPTLATAVAVIRVLERPALRLEMISGATDHSADGSRFRATAG
jgi:transcriptional regulator with XRE-family HTH domain